jgi:hypothetical protein
LCVLKVRKQGVLQGSGRTGMSVVRLFVQTPTPGPCNASLACYPLRAINSLRMASFICRN